MAELFLPSGSWRYINMDFFNAIFQGIIQGLTEFLPVSSSGHLAIYQHITGMQENNLFFSVMLHIGTLSAVLAIYFKTVLKLFSSLISIFKKLIHRNFVWKEMTPEENLAMMIIIGLIPLFLLFIPIPMTDMKIKDIADKFALDGYFLAVGIALLGTSTLLFLGNSKKPDIKIINGKKYKKKMRKKYHVPDAIIVGVTQCFAAIFPGLSRSGSTLAASQLRGISKQTALDYSFLLGTPAIVAAAILETKDALCSEGGVGDLNIFCVFVGMIVSAIVGFLAIKIFKWLLASNKMKIFIIYTAVVGLAVVIISIIELVSGQNLFSHQALHF